MAKIIKRGPAVIVLLPYLLIGNVGSVWARGTDKIRDDKTTGNKTADNAKKENENPGASANVEPTANAPSSAVENEMERHSRQLWQALLRRDPFRWRDPLRRERRR
jgi:hypothetical protein